MNNTKPRKEKLKPFSYGELFVVATPIGNLKDFTFRAVETLKTVDFIACEDTRQTRKLLDHYGVSTKCVVFHEHSKQKEFDRITLALQQGERVALVSDAGTPLISDPGQDLVIEAVKLGIKVTPIPGACAITASISACGLHTESFLFAGFLSHKMEQRKKSLLQLAQQTSTIIIYESPNRVNDLIKDILDILGDRQVVVAREITKLYEEFIRGKASDLLDKTITLKGECVVLIEGAKEKKVSEEQIIDELVKAMKEMSIKDAVEIVSKTHDFPRKITYSLALKHKNSK